jgi:hypothetical protein
VQNGGTRTLKFNANGTIIMGPEVTNTTVYFRTILDLTATAKFFYGYDGINFTQLGGNYLLTLGKYRGDRIGIYNYNNSGATGYIDADWIHYAYAGPVPPLFASSPVPASSLVNVSTSPTLNWQPGNGATAHQVYFGAYPILSSANYQGQQTSTNFTPPALAPNTTYYWRVDEVNSNGVQAGNVWSFTTWWTPPVSITISNPSFESQTVSSGSYLSGNPTSWHSSLLAGTGTVDAVVNPGPLGSGEPWPADPPPGLDATNFCQIYAISAGGGGLVYQDTGVKYQPGTVYQLTAAVGLQNNQTFDAGSLIGFFNSSLTCIASNVINPANIFYSTFTGQSLSYTATGAEGGNGDIIVGFYAPPAAAANSYFDFDNVQLSQYNQGPLITNQPGSQTTFTGGAASFSVGASGTAPFSYQWQATNSATGGFTNLLNGGQISGATSNVLTITGVTVNQALAYQVIVANSYGSVTSSPAATLTLLPSSFLVNVQYRGSTTNIDGSYGLGPGTAFSGAAVLGAAGDTWNQEQVGYYNFSGNGAPNPIISGAALVNSANTASGLTLALGYQSIVQGAALAGSATDAVTTNLMQSSVFIYTWSGGSGAGNARTTHTISGLSGYAGSAATLMVYAGAPSAQTQQIAITGGASGGNSGSTLTTSSTSRSITNGVGVAYQVFTNLTLTGSNLVFTVNETGAAVNVNAGYVNGFQLQIGAPTSPASTNAYLTSLALNPALTFTPAFASNVLSYAATEAYGSVPVVAVTNADLTATNQLIYNGTTNLLGSGVASAALAMNPNPGVTNVVQVQVMAQDGVTMQTYTVNVTQLPNQATQPGLTNGVSNGTLNLTWGLDRLGYRLLVQTNNLNLGVSGNSNDWATVTGSTATNVMAIPIIQTNFNEYYRLVYP